MPRVRNQRRILAAIPIIFRAARNNKGMRL